MRIISNIFLLVIVVILTFPLIGCSNQEEEQQTAPLRHVRSIVIDDPNNNIQRSFSGTLQSSNLTSFSFKVSGTIESINVEVGQSIKKGFVIAKLDPSDYELELEKARANLNEAQSELRNANADYDRTRKLYEAGNSSRNDLDEARAQAEIAAAATLSARKSLQITQADLSYTQLKTDADCKVASIPSDAGENVQQGTEIISAICGQDMEVELGIPESFIANIKKDMPVNVSFTAIQDKLFKGIVKEVGVATIGGGTTFPVDVLIINQDDADLKSGLSADVLFDIDNPNYISASYLVPVQSVGEDQNGRFVYLVEPSNEDRAVIKRLAVTIGEIQQNGIEITDGVEPGMRLVTAGVSVLRDGMEVKVNQ
ncbi:MAG: efflux RND transporter periplasmic adaptor subunit [Pseudomonadota bacterium]